MYKGKISEENSAGVQRKLRDLQRSYPLYTGADMLQ